MEVCKKFEVFEKIKNYLGESNLIKVKDSDSNEIFKINLGVQETSITFTLEYKDLTNDLKEIFKRSGLIDVEVTYTPSRDSQARFTGQPELLRPKKIKEWESWFNAVCIGPNDIFYLIPDTNFLIDGYYTNFLRRIIKNKKYKENVRLRLSRITILELEQKIKAKSDEQKKKAKSDEGELEKLPDMTALYTQFLSSLSRFNKMIEQFPKVVDGKFNQQAINWAKSKVEKEKKDTNRIINYFKEMRNCYLGLKEAYAMISDGAIHTEINKDNQLPIRYFLEDKGIPDSLIRMEFALMQKKPSREYIFLASDFANSLSANAENISTMYFSRKEEVFNGKSKEEFENLIFNSAVQFNSCKFTIENGSDVKEFTMVSWWSSKTPSDWLKDMVQIL